MIKNFLLILAGIFLGIIVIGIRPPFATPGMSRNDIHVAWLISGKEFFVKNGDLLETNPELVSFDNPKESFAPRKAAGVYRIFCIGGSTTRGWPFHRHLPYPKVLGLYLKDLLPDKNIEIINAGFIRSSSHVDIRLLRELVKYQPDLILAYEGRNEYLNLPLYAGINAKIVRLHIMLLRNFPLYRAMNYFYDDNINGGQKLRDFAYITANMGSRLLTKHYVNNLKTMSDICRDHGCDIIFLSQLRSSPERNTDSYITNMNSLLMESGKKYGWLIFDIAKAYEVSGFAENDMVMDYTFHCDYMGYMLIAKEICKLLCKNDIISPHRLWRWENFRSYGVYLKILGFNSDILNHAYFKLVIPLAETASNESFGARFKKKVAEYKALYEKNQ